MGKHPSPEVRAHRIETVRRLMAQGKTPHEAALEMGLNSGSVFHIVKSQGIAHAKRKRPTTEASRRARRLAYIEKMRTDWQVADTLGHCQELIERAQRLLQCDARHAAWLLNCPYGTYNHC